MQSTSAPCKQTRPGRGNARRPGWQLRLRRGRLLMQRSAQGASVLQEYHGEKCTVGRTEPAAVLFWPDSGRRSCCSSVPEHVILMLRKVLGGTLPLSKPCHFRQASKHTHSHLIQPSTMQEGAGGTATGGRAGRSRPPGQQGQEAAAAAPRAPCWLPWRSSNPRAHARWCHSSAPLPQRGLLAGLLALVAIAV